MLIKLAAIFFSMILVNNYVLVKFYGICPFLGVSKKFDSAVGMSGAVIFVMFMATAVTFPLQIFVLNPAGLSYLQTIVERCEKRFTVQQLQTLEEMLNIINNELMPEINLDDRKKRQRNLNVMSELEN